MDRKMIDARGKPCPQPVVLTRKALAETAQGEEFEILVDNETAKQNVEHFLKAQGAEVESAGKAGVYRIYARKTACVLAESPQDASCPIEKTTGRHVVCLRSDRMGMGNDELGDVLIRAFINILGEIKPLPATVVFYNTGIRLALRDSPVLESLEKLQTLGVKVLICGTCLDFFGQKDNVGVGTVSNMYDIAETLCRASHVVSP